MTTLLRLTIVAGLALGLVFPNIADAKRRARRAKDPFIFLVKNFERMSPKQVLGVLKRLKRRHFLTLSIYQVLGSAIHRRACMANPRVWMVIGGQRTTCYKNWMQYRQAVGWVGAASIQRNINTARGTVLTAHRCSTGALSKRACRAYMGTLRQYHRSHKKIGTQTLLNMGYCRVGVDPGCRR
jgi:hypothetical protein